MARTSGWTLALVLLLGGLTAADEPKLKVEKASVDPPKELGDIGKLLSNDAVKVMEEKGDVVCEIWLRKEIPVKATAEQVKNGLTFQEVPETTILGAIKLSRDWTDFRKQKIKAGLYTLRLGYQPMDGDHMGTAPHPEFCLLVPAEVDKKPDTMEAKALFEMSMKATAKGSHPGVMLLYPPEKKVADAPKLVSKGDGILVLSWKADAKVMGGDKVVLGINLTVAGHSTGE